MAFITASSSCCRRSALTLASCSLRRRAMSIISSSVISDSESHNEPKQRRRFNETELIIGWNVLYLAVSFCSSSPSGVSLLLVTERDTMTRTHPLRTKCRRSAECTGTLNVLSWNINTHVLNHLLIHLLRHLAVSVDLLCVFVHLLASRGNVCVCVFPLRHPADKLQTSRDTQISDYTFQSFWDVHRISWGILPEELQFNSASLASEWLCRFYFTVYSFIHECLITWFSIWKIYGDSRNKV